MLSIVIPVYNEEAQIPALWDNLMKIEPCEILFVDGGSSDHTVEILAQKIKDRRISDKKEGGMKSHSHHLKLLHSPKKGRAAQMNFGAEQSVGEILLFLHADSRLPQTAVSDVRKVIRKRSAGCFRLGFFPNSLLMACCAFMSGSRVKCRRIMFGDQGIFMTRSLFERLSGFSDLPIMEDYDLSIRLKENGVRLGMTGSRIMTSGRRFEKGGPLRTMYRMQKLQYWFRKGESIEKIAKAYRDVR